MNKKLIFKIILTIFCYSCVFGNNETIINCYTDKLEEALKYYPLNTGDIRIYEITMGTSIWADTAVVGEDTLMDNGKIYKLNDGYFERVDQLTANVYWYDNVNNSEVLIDSLLCRVGDSFATKRHPAFSDIPGQMAKCYHIKENKDY